jgi:RHS repeat-associated protein
VPVGATGRVSYVETRLLDKTAGTLGNKRDHYHIYREFVDGLGRNLMKKEEAEPGSGGTPRVVVTGAQTFNARQKPSRLLNAFFSLQPGDIEAQLSFEDITAAGWQGAFQLDGGLVNRTLATAHFAAYEYDAALRETRTINPDGSFGTTVYEPLAAKVFDENDNDNASPDSGTPTMEISDGLGRLVRVDQVVKLDDEGNPAPLATWTTRYQYDLNDCLTRITDAQNNVKELHYDGLRRKVFMTDPNRGPMTNVFDDASNLRSTTDGKGQRISYSYDGLNRLITEDFQDENSAEFSYQRGPDIVYAYDLPASSVRHGDGTRSTARNTRGLLAYVIDATGEEHISYDDRGRVEWTVKQVLDPQRGVLVPYTTRVEHDAIDRITGLVYPDNDRVSYEFNERNLIRRITGGPTGSIISNIEYAPSAQQTRIVYGNGVQTDYAYDSRRRVGNLRTMGSGGQPELLHFQYGFDPASNIKSIDDRRSTSLIPVGDQRRNTQTFEYDNLYRLTRVNYNPPNLTTTPTTNFIAYRYDRIGNMLAQTSDIVHVEDGHSVTQPGVMTYGGGAAGRYNRSGRTEGSPPGPHALTAVGTNGARSYPYDANGNMTNIDGMACTWDYRDRLVAVEDETMRASYRYDYMDRRITRHVLFKGPNGQPTNSTATIYVNKHFEVRDAEQPTKYVFNGSTRVAHVTGSLSSAPRLQRMRLATGWNIVSVAVTATNLWGQLEQQPSLVQVVYRWDDAANDYTPVTPGQAVAANSVLWIKASTNAVVGVSGTYAEPGNRIVPAGGAYVAGPGLEKLDLTDALPSVKGLWMRPSPLVEWNWRLMGDLSSLSNLPRALAPGDALYVQSSTATVLEVPDAALRVRYYHQDHLGSSSVMTDATGSLVEEAAYYPFGMPRNEHRVRQVEEYYGFTQKERDRESGLHYFEARFMSAAASRFISPDPKYLNPDRLSADNLTGFLRLPGKGNLYAYALNNPVRYADPTGLDDLDKVTKGVDTVGLLNSFAEASDALENNPGVKVAGKTVTVISLGVKGAQFIADPSADTGGQLAYEGTKTALSMTIPPVGVILAILDLADVGPSAALAAIEKTIKYNREATKHYKEAAKHAKETARIYNEGYNKIKPRLDQLRPRIDQLEKMTKETVAKIKENQRWTQAEIKRLERQIQYQKRLEKAYKRLEKKILEQ